MGVDPMMHSFALTFLLLLLLHNPANAGFPIDSCMLMRLQMKKLNETRGQVLKDHKPAEFRAYQLKYKLQKMEEQQSALKNRVNECDNSIAECKTTKDCNCIGDDASCYCKNGKCILEACKTVKDCECFTS